jgi:enediyne biosynthesis protein E7
MFYKGFRSAIQNLRHFVNDPLSFMHEVHEKNGDLCSLYLGHKKFHFMFTPELAEHVLNTNASYYRKSRLIFNKIKPITGKSGLVQLEGDHWSQMRQMTSEVFHRTYLDDYIHIINQYTDKLVAQIKKHLETSNTVDISSLMIRNTINIAVKIFCGHSQDKQANIIADKFIELNSLCGRRMRQVISCSLIVPTALNRNINRIRRELSATFDELITTASHGDHLNLLAKLSHGLQGQQNKNDLIKDQMMTFIFAGYETTAASLAFCFYLLAKYKPHQQKIRDGSLIGSSEHAGCAYREALRLYPPAYMLAREVLQDDQLEALAVKKGDNLILSLYEIHRHTNYWKNANEFIPERFLKTNHSGTSANRHKFAFIPFGYGKRICSGMQLAFIEASIVLEKLLSHFTFSLSKHSNLAIEAMVTLHPKGEVNLIVEAI